MLVPAAADEAANRIAVDHLYAGTLAAGDAELAAILAADPGNDDARIGLGTIRFVRSIETFSQGLYRYGLKTPRSFLMPILRLPVPDNPNPETLRFEDFQALLAGFSDDLAPAEETLDGVGPEVKLRLDLRKVHYDVNGDGKVLEDESFIAVMQQVTGMPSDAMPAELTFAFDQGDALWLRGYCHVLMGLSDFIVAHDWHESFDAAFHHFFPKTDSPFAAALAAPDENNPMYSEGAPVADFISFFHIRWPVSDPALMAGVRQHIKAMIALSRESWNSIEAETDDDLEWLPNPRQKSPFESVQVNADADRGVAERARPGGVGDRRQEARAALALQQGLQPRPGLRRAAAVRHGAVDHRPGGAPLPRGRSGLDVRRLAEHGRYLRWPFRRLRGLVQLSRQIRPKESSPPDAMPAS